jgi:hypothetical protein
MDESHSDVAGSRPRAMTEPAYIDSEFCLVGVEDFKSSLESLLKGMSHTEVASKQDSESQGSTSVGAVSPPPGLAPPPGLEAPPGLELEGGPPGLEFASEKNVKKRVDKSASYGAAWSQPQANPNPLPPGTTTAMLRNIPNKYSQDGLVEQFHLAGYRGELDFIYLPIDFKNKCNVGYAFVNFRTAKACARFAMEYNGFNSRDKLPGFNSKKICEVSAARHQGCEANVHRLQASSVMSELLANPAWLPKLFDENGEVVDFPFGDTCSEVSQSSNAVRGRLQRRKGTM